MGLLNSVLQTAKGIFIAGHEDRLYEYVSDKLRNLTERIGVSLNNQQKHKAGALNWAVARLAASTFDNEDYQKKLDDFIRRIAQSREDYFYAYYYKCLGWLRVRLNVEEDRNTEGCSDWPLNYIERQNEMYTEAALQCVGNIDMALKNQTYAIDPDIVEWLREKKENLSVESSQFKGNCAKVKKYSSNIKEKFDGDAGLNSFEGSVNDNAYLETLDGLQITAEEKSYMEDVRFCMEDNSIISELDRKYLERKRKNLEISEERAAELEKRCRQSIVPLTSEEKEYLETFKELSVSNIVTDRVRRLLEREREALNISKERADEIEKMASEN